MASAAVRRHSAQVVGDARFEQPASGTKSESLAGFGRSPSFSIENQASPSLRFGAMPSEEVPKQGPRASLNLNVTELQTVKMQADGSEEKEDDDNAEDSSGLDRVNSGALANLLLRSEQDSNDDSDSDEEESDEEEKRNRLTTIAESQGSASASSGSASGSGSSSRTQTSGSSGSSRSDHLPKPVEVGRRGSYDKRDSVRSDVSRRSSGYGGRPPAPLGKEQLARLEVLQRGGSPNNPKRLQKDLVETLDRMPPEELQDLLTSLKNKVQVRRSASQGADPQRRPGTESRLPHSDGGSSASGSPMHPTTASVRRWRSCSPPRTAGQSSLPSGLSPWLGAFEPLPSMSLNRDKHFVDAVAINPLADREETQRPSGQAFLYSKGSSQSFDVGAALSGHKRFAQYRSQFASGRLEPNTPTWVQRGVVHEGRQQILHLASPQMSSTGSKFGRAPAAAQAINELQGQTRSSERSTAWLLPRSTVSAARPVLDAIKHGDGDSLKVAVHQKCHLYNTLFRKSMRPALAQETLSDSADGSGISGRSGSTRQFSQRIAEYQRTSAKVERKLADKASAFLNAS